MMFAQRTAIAAAAATLACTAFVSVDAAAVDTSAVAKRGANMVFKSNFDSMPASSRPDIAKFAGNTAVGCTGFLRDGSSCSGGDVNAEIAANPDGSGNCMKINYQSGKYASSSGVQFYTQYSDLGDEANLEYDVFFPNDFDWVNGGKLPGLHGGNMQCTGSKEAPNGHNCWSTRLMWEAGGEIEGYLYLPISKQEDDFCKKCHSSGGNAGSCDELSGQDFCHFERGAATLKKGVWTHIRQYVKMNTPGQTNGVFELWVNGQLVASADDVYYRATEDISVRGLLFSTFFGGDSSSYAPDSDQQAYFKNVQVYA